MEQSKQSNRITAIYCRTAASDPTAIERQRDALLHYAAVHGFGNVQIFEDDGSSGLNDARPDFTRMNEFITEGRVARVLTQNISRIGRGTASVLAWARMAQEHGVDVITLDMGHISDLFATMRDVFERVCGVGVPTQHHSLHTNNTAQPN